MQAQYALTLYARLKHYTNIAKTKTSSVSSPDTAGPEPQHVSSPYITWIINALRGLPTDEDVRKTYFWECRSLAAREMEAQIELKRQSRLQRLWRAQWYSMVHLLMSNKDGKFEKNKAFAMIQGHRFVWWRSITDFDHGEEPAGRIFLAGHAGIATPSPLELRMVAPDEVNRLISIFGRGVEKQEKITIITTADNVRDELERAVTSATSKKAD